MIQILKDLVAVTVVVAILAIFIFGLQIHNKNRIDNQAITIEQLQGDVRAMTSAFDEISLELMRYRYAYNSWSKEIKKLWAAKDAVPEIPEVGRWENKKEATRGPDGN